MPPLSGILEQVLQRISLGGRRPTCLSAINRGSTVRAGRPGQRPPCLSRRHGPQAYDAPRLADGRSAGGTDAASSRLNDAVVAFFNLAKHRAKLVAVRRITTYVVILASHPCDHAARGILPQAAGPASALDHRRALVRPPPRPSNLRRRTRPEARPERRRCLRGPSKLSRKHGFRSTRVPPAYPPTTRSEEHSI